MSDDTALAAKLNQECQCIGTDVPVLLQRLDSQLGDAGSAAPIIETHPHLFSEAPVFIAQEHVREMQRVIAAIETVTRLPAYRELVLGRAPAIAREPQAAHGVFFGYDFHIGTEGPRLIEINTNAGGALLNVEMQRAQQACCPAVADYLRLAPTAGSLEDSIFEMFMLEWRRARRAQPLATVAIVDARPREQYLFLEFLLFQRLFEARGIRALITDPSALTIESDALTCEGQRIDLVYNRSTDFYFDNAAHAVLAEAYERQLAVITPHPHAHALFSSKRNFVELSDAVSLRAFGAAEPTIEILRTAIPRTLRVEGSAEHWWTTRKQWFFKPVDGFGSRGAFRGDKITRRVFADVMRGDYIAQEIAPPSERRLDAPAGSSSFKLDVRSYVYDGIQQLLAARLYQGQTTNFRSAGGGFAPVYLLRDGMRGTAAAAGGLIPEGLCSTP